MLLPFIKVPSLALMMIATSPSTVSATISSNDNGAELNPLNFLFRENVGLNSECSTIEYFVNQFFQKEFLQTLVEQTNTYASQIINQNGPVRSSSRIKAWTSTNVEKMRLFWGLFLYMGSFTLSSINLYCNMDILYQSTLWFSVISRNRFQLLLRCLHFTNNSLDSHDKLYKILPILNHLMLP